MRPLAAIAFVLLLAGPVAAAPEDVANRISNQVMSPFCPGVTLHDCASQQADDLRARIRGWAEEGWSEEAIMNELRAEYGPGISAVPAGDVGGIPPWLLPALVAGAGLLFTGALARRWTKAREEDRRREELELRRSARVTPEQRARIDAELAAHQAAGLGGADA